MRPEVIALVVAIAGIVLGRRIAREWVRDRWLDDTLSNRQAAILFWLLGAGPLLLIGLIALISDPPGAVILGALLIFVLLPMTTLLVAAIDYRPTRDLKRQQHSNRETSPS